MIELDEHDRFVVTRRRRVTVSPSLQSVDRYEFELPDAKAGTPPFCHVGQRVARSNVRIGFYADDGRTDALMYLNMQPRFDPWARCELTDTDLHTIGKVQKAFVPRRRRSHYVLYGREGDEVARVEPHVPDIVGRRRAARLAVGAAAGVLGIPVVGAVGVVAVASLGVAAAVRQVHDWVDPVDVASELSVLRGEEAIGVLLRRPPAGTFPVPVPWESAVRVYEIDMRADIAKTVDRRLVLAIPVALETLRGILPQSALR